VAAAYGAHVGRGRHPLHGATSIVTHDGAGVFAGLPSPFRAARYHSLAVDASTIPDALQVTAVSEDGEVMGITHRIHPVTGVQFHPESTLSEHGYRLLANFLGMVLPVGVGDTADDSRMRPVASLRA